jgi:hypothetical protein
MFDITAAKLEIAARNVLRQVSGLPALDMAVELRRSYKTHRHRQWNEFLQANDRLFSRALRRAVNRRACGCPASWRPNFITGMMLHNRVLRLLATRFERGR